MKFEVEYSYEMTTDLIINRLKIEHKNAQSMKDIDLSNAIDIVLEYFMNPEQWTEWNKEKKNENGSKLC